MNNDPLSNHNTQEPSRPQVMTPSNALSQSNSEAGEMPALPQESLVRGGVLQPLNEAQILQEKSQAADKNGIDNAAISTVQSDTNQDKIEFSGPRPLEVDLPPIKGEPIHKHPTDPTVLPHTEGGEQHQRFPWVRTLLIGLIMPILLSLGITGVIWLIARLNISITSIYMLAATPYVVGFIIMLIGSKLFSLMEVRSPLVLAIGIILFSVASLQLFTTLSSTPFGLMWGWQDAQGFAQVAQLIMIITLPFIGVISSALLVLPTNILKEKLPNFLNIIIFLLIVAAPFGANYIAKQNQPTLEDLMSRNYTLRDHGTESEGKNVNTEGAWPLLPATAYPGYKTDQIEKCINSGMVVAGVLRCSMYCVDVFDGACVDIYLASGQRFKEHEPYLYKDGKCNPSNIAYVMNNVRTGDALPKVRMSTCRILKTPEGRTLYGEDAYTASGGVPNRINYYYATDEGIVELILSVKSEKPLREGGASITTAHVQTAEVHLLGFIDTFEVAERK